MKKIEYYILIQDNTKKDMGLLKVNGYQIDDLTALHCEEGEWNVDDLKTDLKVSPIFNTRKKVLEWVELNQDKIEKVRGVPAYDRAIKDYQWYKDHNKYFVKEDYF